MHITLTKLMRVVELPSRRANLEHLAFFGIAASATANSVIRLCKFTNFFCNGNLLPREIALHDLRGLTLRGVLYASANAGGTNFPPLHRRLLDFDVHVVLVNNVRLLLVPADLEHRVVLMYQTIRGADARFASAGVVTA